MSAHPGRDTPKSLKNSIARNTRKKELQELIEKSIEKTSKTKQLSQSSKESLLKNKLRGKNSNLFFDSPNLSSSKRKPEETQKKRKKVKKIKTLELLDTETSEKEFFQILLEDEVFCGNISKNIADPGEQDEDCATNHYITFCARTYLESECARALVSINSKRKSA